MNAGASRQARKCQPGCIQCSAAIADGVVYFGCRDSNVYALDALSGAKKWAYSNHAAALTKKDGDPDYAEATRDSCYDSMDIGSNKMWSVGAVLSSPVIERDMIYFGSTDCRLYAIS